MNKTRIRTVSEARTNLYNLVDETAKYHEPVLITWKRNNAFLVWEEDWNAILETIHLNLIPWLAESIKEEMNKKDEEFSDKIEW